MARSGQPHRHSRPRPEQGGKTTGSGGRSDQPHPIPGSPLYKEAASADRKPEGSSGLWYDKFCDRWKADWTGFAGDSGKREWIETIANVGDGGATRKTVGNREILAEAAKRIEDLAAKNSGQTFRLATAWRFVTGLGRSHPVENGFAWHHTLGTPYLPGSSLKGLTRAWARDWSDLGADDVARMFGPEANAKLSVGSVIFLDALPVAPVALEADVMTPHYGPWYQGEKGAVPGDWHSPTPIPFLTVAPGQTFLFAVLPRTASAQDRKDCNTAATLLKEALDGLGAGAKTSVGYGQFVETALPVKPSKSSAGDEPASKPRSLADGKVGGDLIRVLQRYPHEVQVEFVETGDVEFVSPHEIEPL